MEYLKTRADSGVLLLEEFHSVLQQTTIEQFALDYGYRVAEVKKLRRAWEMFKPPAIRRVAATGKLSYSTLLDLTTIAYPLMRRGDRVEKLRLLCQLVAGKPADVAKKLAYRQVKEWTKHTSDKAPNHARCHSGVGRDGKRRLVAAYDQQTMAHIETIITSGARKLMKKDGLSFDHACAVTLYNKITGNGAGQKFGPMFMIATDYRFHSDGQIATVDGALVDLKDVIDTELATTGYAAVIAKNVDNNHQPEVATFVQVQRTWPNDPADRFAGEELRLKAVLDALICAWPGCEMPAIQCQAHHIQAHQLGGATTGPNITALCPRHNGLNDDNPAKHKNGRIERDPITGQAGLQRRPGECLTYNQHPAIEKSSRSYIKFAYRS